MHRIILLLLILIACEKETPRSLTESIIPVKKTTAHTQDVTFYVESIGTLKPFIFIEIHPQVEGVLQEVLADEGSWVKENTPLFKINPELYLQKMKEAEAQIKIDEADLRFAHQKLERFNRLADKDLIAKSEWDRHLAEIAKREGLIELDQRKLEILALNALRCTILAPMDGYIGKIDAYPGHLISLKQDKPLTTLVKLDPLLVEFHLSENDYQRLKEIKAFSFSSLSRNENIQGNMTFIDHHFDPKTGRILMQGAISNSKLDLKPGQLGRVKIPIETHLNALLLPQKAIKQDSKGAYVYVISDGLTATARHVTLGGEIGDHVIIKEGIRPNDEVITEGHLRLFRGAPVAVIE